MLLSEFEPSEPMEMGCELGLKPLNFYMPDITELKLKQARSPLRSALIPATTHEDDMLEEHMKVGTSRNSSSAASEGRSPLSQVSGPVPTLFAVGVGQGRLGDQG